jgi:aminoglycoside 6'-N-acetyltransferase I
VEPLLEAFRSLEGRFGLIPAEDDRHLALAGVLRHQPRCYELDPLCVDPDAQGRGLGRAMLEAAEREAARRGALILWLGTEDESGTSTLFGRDLWDDPIAALATLEPVSRESPIGFYPRCGYRVCSVPPDSGGPGRPDIILARSLRNLNRRPSEQP